MGYPVSYSQKFYFRLMANPDKPVFIPDRPKDKDVNKCAEFNHNIMGRYVLSAYYADQKA